MDTVIDILESLKPGIDYAHTTDLVTSRVLDSLTIIALVGELEDEYDISIPAVEIVVSNFNSAAAIYALVERLASEETL